MNEQTSSQSPRYLSDDDVKKRIQTASLAEVTAAELVSLFMQETAVQQHLPDGRCQQDPRDGAIILYNEVRNRRPHDNKPDAPETAVAKPCPICAGNTTKIVDAAPLSQGFTFINKNMYPVVYPVTERDDGFVGLHFLQWTSSHHDADWHNMPQADRATVLARLAALEQTLLLADAPPLPTAEAWPGGWRSGGRPVHGYLGIFKNYGYLVGGSLMHGHQQMMYSPTLPPAFAADWAFYQAHGKSMAAYLRDENPEALLLRDYGEMVLCVPYFMKRPYQMLLFPKQDRTLLSELTAAELAMMADGWHDAIRAIRTLLPSMGREIAYNVVVHNGPGAGLYVEFLPYSQETGGMEHLGWWICQQWPETAVADLRRVLDNPTYA
ncbi:MAG: hypothetical protein KC443_09865 [Anaerolineales bacterium]|nr:hypothetical protein [Anaerolineales bacterium]